MDSTRIVNIIYLFPLILCLVFFGVLMYEMYSLGQNPYGCVQVYQKNCRQVRTFFDNFFAYATFKVARLFVFGVMLFILVMFRQLIKVLKISVGTSIRSASTTSDAISQIESSIRQAFPRAKISITIVPKYKVIVSAPEFSFQSVKDRHQSVIENIPLEYRDQVEIQAFADDDSELVRLELPQSIPLLKCDKIPATPQIHVDNAVYFLSNGDTVDAREYIWLSGSLQLKIYAKAYGIAIKSSDGEKMLVSFINKKYNLSRDFKFSWYCLQMLRINYYNEIIPCEELEYDLKQNVLFSNQLFDLKATAFSKEEFQDYIKTTLKFGHLFKENTEDKRQIDSYFKFD